MKHKLSGKLIITNYTYEKNHTSHTCAVACFMSDNQLEYIKVVPEDCTLPVGTILTGKVQNVVPNIPAAFISLNETSEIGFLSMSNLKYPILTNTTFTGSFKSGDEVVVQVLREPMKTKGYTLTDKLSLTDTYAVAQTGGGRLLFSKNLSSYQKETIFEYLVSKAVITREKQLIGISDFDVTIRTAAAELINKDIADDLKALVADIQSVVSSLENLIQKAKMRTCYAVHHKPTNWLYEVWNELSLCGFEIEEYVTDHLAIKTQLQEFLPKEKHSSIRFYQDDAITLSALYSLHTKLDNARSKKVWLKSGAYLVIEATEAMTVIDVNSGKNLQKTSHEQLYFDINLEAAEEIARQIRLRNISGIVVVDFVNMNDKEHEKTLISHINTFTKNDFSDVFIYDFTRLGLLELTRSKKSKALHEIL